MPNPKDFDLDFRPTSYWGPATLERHFGSRINGEIRRRLVLDDLAQGIQSPDCVLASELDGPNRQTFGAIHPHFMGGEYLPSFKNNEVEIARAVLESVTLDVISIRARLAPSRIHYRIVDEYGAEGSFPYEVHPKTGQKPLSFKQLIRMIDRCAEHGLDGNARHCNYENGGGDPADLSQFCRISSEFYPELSTWFDTKNDEWLTAEQERIAKEKEEDQTDQPPSGKYALTPEDEQLLFSSVSGNDLVISPLPKIRS